MPDDQEIFGTLKRHGARFVIIGGHAVNFHGYLRVTEDTDVVWIRSPESEQSLLAALREIDARYIGKDIDPATGIERTYPVTLAFIQSSHLMMLTTRCGYLDLFDYVPGAAEYDAGQLLASSVEHDGLRYASLDSLRQMKRTAGREKDRTDLEKLGE